VRDFVLAERVERRGDMTFSFLEERERHEAADNTTLDKTCGTEPNKKNSYCAGESQESFCGMYPGASSE
jgi:hypothetical protein